MKANNDARLTSSRGSAARVAAVLLGAAALSLAASAATGTWSGAASGTWDTTASNWSGVSGTPWNAANGPTNDAVFNTASLNATVSGTVYAKSITFSTGGTLNYGTDGAISFSGSSTLSAASGQKGSLLAKVLGSGTLTKADGGTNYIYGPAWGANTFSGAVVLNAGTLHIYGGTTAGGNANSGRGLGAATPITVNSGAVLLCEGSSPLNGDAPVTITGGSLIKKTGANQYATLGALTLTNGTVLSARGAGSSFQGFGLNGTVTVGGTAASTIGTQGGANSGVHLFFNVSTDNNPRLFNVDDATGNADADLIVSVPLLDSSHTGARSGPIKDGAGTMLLSAANAYTGRTVVRDGTLKLGVALAVASSSGLTMNGGVLDLNGFTVTNAVLDGSVAGSGGVVSNGTLAVTTTVSPGGSNTVGSVTLPNAPDLSGTLWVDVTSGGACDQLKVTGNLSVTKLDLRIVDVNLLNKASEYTIAQCTGGTVTGTFLSHNLPDMWKVFSQGDRMVIRSSQGTLIRFL